jgi:uncharacterized protein YwqG
VNTFIVPPVCFSCRSEHLYVFFIQWSPDMYGEGVRGVGREPGFRVVKKNQDSEKAAEEPVTDINVKEWEVGNGFFSSM